MVQTVELVVVNRRGSSFGPAWWLAGLEELLPGQPGGRLLWVGGDGSARVYAPIGGGEFVAPNHATADTIRTVTVDGSLFYRRRLRDGTWIWYNDQGRHHMTRNRLNHDTYFEHATVGGKTRLQTIYLPRPANAPSVHYSFVYNAQGLLERVAAPPLENRTRETILTRNPSTRDLTITDPDSQSVRYTHYDGFWFISSQTDRRQTRTEYHWNYYRLARTWRYMHGGTTPGPDDIVTYFTPAEYLGLPGTAAVGTADAYTLINGPRFDVAQQTFIWVDRWGAPRRIRDALGNRTHIFREYNPYPALVTRVVAPNGYTRTATYDSRARLTRTVGVNSLGDGRNDTTSYAYAAGECAYFVARVTAPEKNDTRVGYDTACRMIWTQPGADATRRTTFGYYEPGSSVTPNLPRSVRAPGMQPEYFEYEPQRGNLSATVSPTGLRVNVLTDVVGRPYRVTSPLQQGAAPDTVYTVYTVMDEVKETRHVGTGINYEPTKTIRVLNEYDAEGNLEQVTRLIAPDPMNITVSPSGTPLMVIRMRYDRANRKVAEIDPDERRDSTVYDPASNVREVRDREDRIVSMSYDAANRLVRRTMFTEVDRFSYDAAGNLRSATNDNARVTRTYHPNGALRTDTIRIRTNQPSHADTLWTGYTAYTYGLLHRYDLNGRRTQLDYPANLMANAGIAGLRSSVRYGYDPLTGALAWVEGLGANTRFDYRYDRAGRPDTTYMPANIREWYRYDGEGRLQHRYTLAPRGGWFDGGYMRADTLFYDHRHKLTGANATVINSQGVGRTQTGNVYDGIGNLVMVGRPMSTFSTEEWRTDALGHHQSVSQRSDWYRTMEHTYYSGTGRLWRRTNAPQDTIMVADTVVFSYNYAGDLTSEHTKAKWVQNPNYGQPYQPQWLRRVYESMYFYRQDGRMNEFRRLSNLEDDAPVNAREFYAYDALGRRVWKRSDNGWHPGAMTRDSVCTRPYLDANCISYVERTVYDGDQIIAELRERGVPSGAADDPGYFEGHFGRVLYTHAGGIDQPLEVVRPGVSSPFVVVPHTDWQGRYDVVTYTGSAYGECGIQFGYGLGSGGICFPFELPAQSAYGDVFPRKPTYEDPGIRSWSGSLMQSGRDASGLLYRRNRYLDPKSGRFTQEDPIGLAGGLNLYGYAGGDPVNFSDPFGLCRRPKGLQRGEVGICIQTFIQRFPIPGVADNRGPRSDGGSYRTNVQLRVNPENGSIAGEEHSRGRTLGLLPAWGRSEATAEGGGKINVAGWGMNTFLAPPFEINYNFDLSVSADGSVQLTGATHDGYPSYEVWVYRDGKDPQLLYHHKEGKLRELRGPGEQRVP